MLKWKIGIQPRGETNRRIGIFKRYMENALLATQATFHREFYKRVNPTNGTHIKSKRILNLLQRGDTEFGRTAATTEMILSGDYDDENMAEMHEYGGTIRASGGRKMLVPKHLSKTAPPPETLKFVKLGNLKGLADPAQWKRARNHARRKTSSLNKGSTRLDWGVKYWLKDSIKVKPKWFFKDAAEATVRQLARSFPRALERQWDDVWQI